MKSALLFVTVLFAAIAVAQQPAHDTETSRDVWAWSKQCSGNLKLGVIIRLQDKQLYRGVLPICRNGRDAESGRVEFYFPGGHIFQGEYHTRSNESIEGDIWQAGGESDALILGVSFATKKQILLNALHVAYPVKKTSTKLDNRLFITTYPVAVR